MSSFVTQMAEHLQVRTASDEDADEGVDFDCFFPGLIWSVRDFTLNLVLDGTPPTPDAYLEHMLQYKKGHVTCGIELRWEQNIIMYMYLKIFFASSVDLLN